MLNPLTRSPRTSSSLDCPSRRCPRRRWGDSTAASRANPSRRRRRPGRRRRPCRRRSASRRRTATWTSFGEAIACALWACGRTSYRSMALVTSVRTDALWEAIRRSPRLGRRIAMMTRMTVVARLVAVAGVGRAARAARANVPCQARRREAADQCLRRQRARARDRKDPRAKDASSSCSATVLPANVVWSRSLQQFESSMHYFLSSRWLPSAHAFIAENIAVHLAVDNNETIAQRYQDIVPQGPHTFLVV